ARQAIGYKEVIAHVRGEATLEEAVLAVTVATARYAKRQRTWFRREPDVHRLPMTGEEAVPVLRRLLLELGRVAPGSASGPSALGSRDQPGRPAMDAVAARADPRGRLGSVGGVGAGDVVPLQAVLDAAEQAASLLQHRLVLGDGLAGLDRVGLEQLARLRREA